MTHGPKIYNGSMQKNHPERRLHFKPYKSQEGNLPTGGVSIVAGRTLKKKIKKLPTKSGEGQGSRCRALQNMASLQIWKNHRKTLSKRGVTGPENSLWARAYPRNLGSPGKSTSGIGVSRKKLKNSQDNLRRVSTCKKKLACKKDFYFQAEY